MAGLIDPTLVDGPSHPSSRFQTPVSQSLGPIARSPPRQAVRLRRPSSRCHSALDAGEETCLAGGKVVKLSRVFGTWSGSAFQTKRLAWLLFSPNVPLIHILTGSSHPCNKHNCFCHGRSAGAHSLASNI